MDGLPGDQPSALGAGVELPRCLGGFDVLLIAVLALTGWYAHRRSPRLVLSAAVAAALLVWDLQR